MELYETNGLNVGVVHFGCGAWRTILHFYIAECSKRQPGVFLFTCFFLNGFNLKN
jgi:hypothetical protein